MATRKTGVNKMELMRQAVSELGKDASGEQLGEWFKAKSVTISPAMISNYKSVVVRGAKKAGKKARMRALDTAVSPAAVINLAETNGHAEPSQNGDTSAVPVGLVGVMNGLVSEYGPNRLKTLIDALAPKA